MQAWFRRSMLLLVLFTLFDPANSRATHLMGGELTYVHDGSTTGGNFYLVKLIVYRYCDSTVNTALLDPNMFLGVYSGNTSGPLDWNATETLDLISSNYVTADPGNAGCSFTATACIQRGEYQVFIFLPDNADGYHLIVERCCRNGNIVNLDNPGNAGMTFSAFVPAGIVNSSPQISDVSVPYICTGDTVSIVNNAFDPDGDSLAYSFVIPYNGYSGASNPIPDPQIDNNPYGIPIPEIIYAPGFNAVNFFGAGSFTFINPVSGLTNYFIPNQGFYVAAIEIREYRNGILISAIRRDLQFIAIACTPNTVPDFAGNGTAYTIGEGQTLCFNITFTDADGDSLFLEASGPLLDSMMVNPPGTISDASGNGQVTSQFCWTPVCGMNRPVPYQFFVSVTDNGCPAKTSNEIFSVYVTTGPSSQTPAVSIQQTPPGLICQGSSVSFTATPTLPGTAPQYQWQVNGIPAGTNNAVFSTGNLNNGDIITVTMISNATCLTNDTAFSPPYLVIVNPQPAPQINITSNPPSTLCPQQICTFTANTTNGGSTPVYQWNLNGSPAGTNNPLFTAANPSGTMTVFVTVIPSTGCPPQSSNVIVFNIVPSLVPSVSLTASVTDSVCPNQQVLFTASALNTGNSPVYAWYLNGVPVGDTSSTLSLNAFDEGDEIMVLASSDYACLSPDFATSDPLIYHIYPPLSGNLTDGPLSICAGLPVSLTMETSGGNSDSFIFNWSNGSSSSSSSSFIPSTTTFYSSTVDDACYDPVTDSIFIEVLPLPVSDFTWEPLIPSVFLPHVQFTDLSIDAISWDWTLDSITQTSEQHPAHDYTHGGTYPVKLITANQYQCTDTLIKIIEIEQIITAYFPNSFTPNGDGINDVFGLTGFDTGGYAISIFNRWGKEVFHSIAGFEKWNGKDSGGRLHPEGVYVYSVTIVNDPSKKPYVGTLTLVR